MTYFLRIAYDTGDMYIKTMSKKAVAKLLREAGKAVSGLRDLAEPSIPDGEEVEEGDAEEESRNGVASSSSGSAASGSSSTTAASSSPAGAQQQGRVTLRLFGGGAQQGAGLSSAPLPAPAAANETGGGGRRALRGSWEGAEGGSGMSARRGLNSIIEDCPACSGNGICRCISGVDNRRQVGCRVAVASLLVTWWLRNRQGLLVLLGGRFGLSR